MRIVYVCMHIFVVYICMYVHNYVYTYAYVCIYVCRYGFMSIGKYLPRW